MSNVLSKPAIGLAAGVAASLSKKAASAAKKDVKRAAKPITKPIKDGIHKARKWVDKATSKVPVLGKFAALPVDIVDDLSQGILLDKKQKHKSGKFVPERLKWQVPQLVDKLGEAKTTAEAEQVVQAIQRAYKHNPKTAKQMVVEPNPGPNHGKKHRKAMHNKKKAARPKRKAKERGPRFKLRIKSKRRIRNKKTGKVVGERYRTTEYLLSTTIRDDANAGDEVIADGLLINPHQLHLPKLSVIAKFWELYRITPIVKLEGISNGVVDCELVGYFDPDVTDTIPADPVQRFQVAENHGGKPGYVKGKGAVWKPGKATRATPLKWFYCDSNGGDGTADRRQVNQYRFRLLVKRPPKLYGLAAGNTGTSAGVELQINLRFSYIVTFRNSTLDQPDVPATIGRELVRITSSSPNLSTTSALGLSQSTSPSVNTISSTFNDPNRTYVFYNNGTRDFISRNNPAGKSMPKYVFVSVAAQMDTLTGSMGINAVSNLTSIRSILGVLGSNVSCYHFMYQVTDRFKSTPETIGAGGCIAHGTSLVYYNNIGDVRTGWYISFNNYTSATGVTTALLDFNIMEFNEGNELAHLELHGPATVEGKLYNSWKESHPDTRPKFEAYVQQYRAIRADRLDELEYWKAKAKGRSYETKEQKFHKSGLSLTPDNSDEEDEYQEFLDYKKSVHKPTGLYMTPKPLKIVQDDEKSEKGVSRPKASSQK